MVSLAFSYRLGHTIVMNSVHMVCAAIEKVMMERFLPSPTQDTWKEVAQGYCEKWNFPNCLGSNRRQTYNNTSTTTVRKSVLQLQKDFLHSAFGACGC